MEKLGGYYNSDLNRFIGEKLPKIMTSIDLDLFQLKKKKKIIRFAEYKHENEKLGHQQKKALEQLGKIAKNINENTNLFDGWKVSVVLIRGNFPFNVIKVYSFIDGNECIITDENKIKSYLTIEN